MIDNERPDPPGNDSPPASEPAPDTPAGGDIEVVIEDAAPEGQDGVTGGDDLDQPEAAQPGRQDDRRRRPSARDRIRELSHQKREAEAATAALQQQLHAAAQREAAVMQRAAMAERAAVESQYQHLLQVQANFAAQKQAALNTGDTGAIVRLDAETARLGAALHQVEGHRARFQQQPQGFVPPQQPMVPQQRPQAPQQPQRLHPAAEQWANNQTEWLGSDPRKIRDARLEAQRLEADGYTPDDPEYYDNLNRRLSTLYSDFRPVNPIGNARASASPHQRPGAPAVAPVDRSASVSVPVRGQVRVTKDDLEAAKRIGIDTSNPKSLSRWALEKRAFDEAEAEKAARRAR